MRSVHIQKDKSIFKLSELPVEAYAASMGLPGAPQIKLLDRKRVKVKERGRQTVTEEADRAQLDIVGSSDEDGLGVDRTLQSDEDGDAVNDQDSPGDEDSAPDDELVASNGDSSNGESAARKVRCFGNARDF